MTLELSGGGLELSSDTWLRVEGGNKVVGLIWDVDVPKKYQYTLTATDSGGLQSNYDIEISVTRSISEPTNHFTLIVKSVFSEFANNLGMQLDLYRKLETAFGGDSVVRFDSVSKGSVVVGFSVRSQQTPKSENICKKVEDFRDQAFSPTEAVTTEFLARLMPFSVSKLSFTPLEPCEGIVNSMEAEIKTPVTNKNQESNSVNVLYFVIPIICGVVLLVVIVVIIVCVKRRRQQKSMTLSQNNGTYIEKGVPVVFEEEMKDGIKKEPHEREPLMDESMKPDPPAYPQNGKSESIPLNAKTGADKYQPPTPPNSQHE